MDIKKLNVLTNGLIYYDNVLCKQYDNGYGYMFIVIKRKNYYVHRLVAETFIPNPHNKIYVNHKDLNKSNNHISNLEWVTPKENMKHSMNLGVYPAKGHPLFKSMRDKKNKNKNNKLFV